MRRGPRKPNLRRQKQRQHRINHEIRVPEVRLVQIEDLETDIEDGAIVKTGRALRLAEELEMDLVEMVAKAKPPVCRIVEYSKFKYELKKREKEAKSRQHTVVVKEIRFGPNTDDHDFNFKLKHARKFLGEGNKIKAYVQFRGRNIVFKDRGRDLLARFSEELKEEAKIEMHPRMEGRRMIMMLAPLPKPKK
ncbi:MAG: translation initiation factor IF-3 [Bacteroidota bacterium]